MAIWVTLTEQQIAEADRVGEARHRSRVASRSVHKNNRPRNNAADLLIDQSAARCELAAHIGLQTTNWHAEIIGHMGEKGPDLDDFIDVKERKKAHHNLIVQLDDPSEWAYVSVCSEEHPDYSIDVWCWGSQAKQQKYRRELVPGRPAYVIHPCDLMMKSPHELKHLVATRSKWRPT